MNISDRWRVSVPRLEHRGAGMMMKKHEAWMMIPFKATVEDIDAGARLVLKPESPADLAGLREGVDRMVEMMNSGHSPMMKGETVSRHEPPGC